MNHAPVNKMRIFQADTVNVALKQVIGEVPVHKFIETEKFPGDLGLTNDA